MWFYWVFKDLTIHGLAVLVGDIRMSRDMKFFLFYLIKIFIGIRGWGDGFC